MDKVSLTNAYEFLKDRYNALISGGDIYSSTGASSVNVTVIDKTGNVTTQIINVWIIANNPVLNGDEEYTMSIFKPVTSYVRFISEEFYEKDTEDGGLLTNSLWKIKESYSSELQNTFDILNNDEGWYEVWVFSADDVKEVQQYIADNGLGNSVSGNALKNFYAKFAETCRIQ
jgi:hypothetical protein